MKTTLKIITLTLVLGLAQGISKAQTVDFFIMMSIDQSLKGDVEKALALLDEGMEKHPENAEIPLKKAEMLMALRAGSDKRDTLNDEIGAMLEKAHQNDLQDQNILNKLTWQYLHLRDTARAFPLCRKMIASDDPEVKLKGLLAKSDWYYDEKDFDTFQKIAREADQVDPDHLITARLWCTYYLFKDMFPEALPYSEKLVAAYSEDLGYLNNYAFILGELKQYEKALEIFNRIIRLDPKSAFPWSNRGHIKFRLGDNYGALKDINQSIHLDPENSYAYRNRALVYLDWKKMDDACKDLQTAREKGFLRMYGPEVEGLIEKNCR
ncbi:MAG: hypothetical protein H6581_10615 [Bacteroidia bacterium]|nr:hypothetical protein [Bacteroidia bacterium]